MKNLEAALVLIEIADLLEVKGENTFKIRAYRNAARSIMHLQEDLGALRDRKALSEIPGVGKAIADKISEILDTGRSSKLESLREEIPPAVLALFRLPGIGIKTARVIHEHLSFEDMEDLKRLAKEKKIRSLPGLGPKTELNIIRGIEMLGSHQDLIPLGLALGTGESMAAYLESLEEVECVRISGSARRGREMVHDVDLVAAASDFASVMELFCKHPDIREILSTDDKRVEAITWLGVKVDLNLTGSGDFAAVWHRSTGSKAHLEGLARLDRGEKSKEVSGRGTSARDEEQIYASFGLPFIPAELREGSGEIEAALEDALPHLVEEKMIRGDLHLHSRWSDGVNSIEEIIGAALQRGYSYVAITDHSRSLAIAGGLSEERLAEQWEEIDRLREKYSPFLILKGIEVDILSNFHLDYGDEILEQMDIVVASIHTGFSQDSAKISGRLRAALENPYVDIIAHPTGRLLGRRPPYEFDVLDLIKGAADTGTVLEINSSPERLDLNFQQVRLAKEAGAKIAVNTDAHDVGRMEDIRFGVTTARRGWLEKDDIINTFSPEELRQFLAQRRKRALHKG